jgi:hypothetical protein
MIGDDMIRGISGGQKKRVTTGMQTPTYNKGHSRSIHHGKGISHLL